MNHEETFISRNVRIVMTFIDRIGFPIVAFAVMAYMCFVSLERNTVALQEIKSVLIGLTLSIDQHNKMATPAIDKILGRK